MDQGLPALPLAHVDEAMHAVLSTPAMTPSTVPIPDLLPPVPMVTLVPPPIELAGPPQLVKLPDVWDFLAAYRACMADKLLIALIFNGAQVLHLTRRRMRWPQLQDDYELPTFPWLTASTPESRLWILRILEFKLRQMQGDDLLSPDMKAREQELGQMFIQAETNNTQRQATRQTATVIPLQEIILSVLAPEVVQSFVTWVRSQAEGPRAHSFRRALGSVSQWVHGASGGKFLSRITAQWKPVTRNVLENLADLASGLNHDAAVEICLTESKRLLHYARSEHTVQEQILSLYLLLMIERFWFFKTMLDSDRDWTLATLKRLCGFVVLAWTLARPNTRGGLNTVVPMQQIMAAPFATDTPIIVTYEMTKLKVQYGTYYTQYNRFLNPILAWFVADIRPKMVEAAWPPRLDEKKQPIPASKYCLPSTADTLLASFLAGRIADNKVTPSRIRSMVCQDLSSLCNDPRFGRHVPDLQRTSEHAVSSSDKLVEQHYSFDKIRKEGVLQGFLEERYLQPARQKVFAACGLGVGADCDIDFPFPAAEVPRNKLKRRRSRSTSPERICLNRQARVKCFSGRKAMSFDDAGSQYCIACKASYLGDGQFDKDRLKLLKKAKASRD